MLIKKTNFQLLVGSQLFSVLGTTVVQFALSLYVLDVTKSAVAFSVVTSMSVIGRLLCLPFGGVLADRLPKRKMMLLMDTSYLVLALALFCTTLLSQSLLVMNILTVVLGMIAALETPLVQSTVPLICEKEEIAQANGIISSIGMLGNIIAPILAGIIYRFETVYLTFFLCAAFFFIAVFCEYFLKIPFVGKQKNGEGIWTIVTEDLKETYDYMKKQSAILRICFIAFLLNFFISSFIQVIIPYISRIQLGITDEQYGLMNTFFAIGSLLGSIFVSSFSKKFSGKAIGYFLVLNSIFFCSLIIPLGLIEDKNLAFWIMLILVTLILSIFTMVSIQLIVYVQMITETQILGRVMSFLLIISTIAMPLGQIIYGSLGAMLNKSSLILLILFLAVVSGVISRYATKSINIEL